ncbi:MAG: imidazolonepropionase, partial [Comamonas sp.]
MSKLGKLDLHPAVRDWQQAPCADGRWLHLRAVNALWQPDVALNDGDEGCIVVEHGRMVWVGPQHAVPEHYAHLPAHDGQQQLVTPGLVDCHTHLVYGGERANEFAMRLEGASYEAIARAGGGIVSSVKATREASEEALIAQALPRLEQL